MNALASDFSYTFKDRDEERYALKGLEGELHRWGREICRHFEHDGTPGANILATFIGGQGGGTPGHRVLCLDMSTEIYVVHMRIVTVVPTDEQDAVLIWYGLPPKEDGTLWEGEEKAAKLGIAFRTLRQRRDNAKRRILGLPVET